MGQLLYVPVSGGGGGDSAPSDLYISAANGNDANDGLTPGTAIATIARLWAVLANGGTPISRIVHVHIASGTYAYAAPPANLTFAKNGGLVLHGDGAGQGGDDGTTTLYTSTITSATGDPPDMRVVDGAAAFVANEWVGKTLTMTSGAGSGYYRQIIENTATDIYYTLSPFGASPGDSYRIFEPAVVFTSAVDVRIPCPVCLLNIRLESAAAFSSRWLLDGRAYFLGLECSNTPRSPIASYDSSMESTTIITGAVFSATWHTLPLTGTLENYVNALFSSLTVLDGWGLSGWDAAILPFSGATILGNTFTPFVGTYAGSINVQNSYMSIAGGRIQNFLCRSRLNLDGARGVLSNTVINSGGQVTSRNAWPCKFTLDTSGLHLIRGGIIAPGAEITFTVQSVSMIIEDNALLAANSATPGVGQVNFVLSGTGGLTIRDSSRVQCGTITTTGTGAVTVDRNSDLEVSGTFTAAAPITVRTNSRAVFAAITSTSTLVVQDRSSVVLTSGAQSFSSTTGTVTISRNSELTQLASSGTLTVTATAGSAIIAEKRSGLVLRGGGSTVTSATAQGVIARSGSEVWFDSSPTSIAGAAGAQLQVGVLAPQDVVGLTGAAAGAFITDTPTGASVGTGGASVIGRAA